MGHITVFKPGSGETRGPPVLLLALEASGSFRGIWFRWPRGSQVSPLCTDSPGLSL